MHRNLLAISVLLVMFLPVSVAQDEVFACGFEVTPEIKKREKANIIHSPGSVQPVQCLKKTLSLFIHIVLDSLNNGRVTINDINQAADELNKDFAGMCLSFKICKIDTIVNYKYDRFDRTLELNEAMTLYGVPKAINMFLVWETRQNNGPFNASFASAAEDYLVIQKSQLTNKKTLSHEMGHFFNLYHTFETQFGAELANGNNCTTAGDLVCDTGADVDPAQFAPGTCDYTGTNKDAAGNYITPIIGNIMSYHKIKCKCPFTKGQFNRMTDWYLSYKNYLR